MNLTQMAAHGSILSVGVKPRVIQAYGESAASDTISVTIPRYPGKLCIVIVASRGNSSTPDLLTGFTSLASSASTSANTAGIRIQYKFLDGSEELTLSTTSATASQIHAHTFLIDGALSSGAPDVSAVAASADPSAVTVTSPVTQTLIIATVYSQTTSAYSPPPGFTTEHSLQTTSNSHLTSAWQGNFCVSSFDPGAFVGPTTNLKSYTIAVRSA